MVLPQVSRDIALIVGFLVIIEFQRRRSNVVEKDVTNSKRRRARHQARQLRYTRAAKSGPRDSVLGLEPML
jgi:hypothetical protein